MNFAMGQHYKVTYTRKFVYSSLAGKDVQVKQPTEQYIPVVYLPYFWIFTYNTPG